MPHLRPLRGLWCLALVALLTSAPAAAQDGPPPQPDSEIGRLLLTLQTTDGRPIGGTRIVIDLEADASDALPPIFTDDEGVARVPAEAFPDGADVTVAVQVRYGSSRLDGDFPFVDSDGMYMSTPTVVLTDDPESACSREPFRVVEVADLFAGCATSETFQWAGQVDLPLRVELEVDASCAAVEGDRRDRWRGSDLVSGRFRTLARSEGDPDRELLGLDERDVDWDYDAYYSRAALDASGTLFPGCENPPPDAELPETAIYALHGYNLDFKDGAWGLRGTTALPFLPRRNLGGALGLDYYFQDDTRSLLAVNADVTTSFPWPALGDASAFFGIGPRALIQFFDGAGGAASSSSTEFGAGAVSGMTYGVGPVSLYGDVGFDYVYSSVVPVTHFGVGFAFSRD